MEYLRLKYPAIAKRGSKAILMMSIQRKHVNLIIRGRFLGFLNTFGLDKLMRVKAQKNVNKAPKVVVHVFTTLYDNENVC